MLRMVFRLPWRQTEGRVPSVFVDDSWAIVNSDPVHNARAVDSAPGDGRPSLARKLPCSLTDGEEVFDYGTDPLAADIDEDGLSDGDEILWFVQPRWTLPMVLGEHALEARIVILRRDGQAAFRGSTLGSEEDL